MMRAVQLDRPGIRSRNRRWSSSSSSMFRSTSTTSPASATSPVRMLTRLVAQVALGPAVEHEPPHSTITTPAAFAPKGAHQTRASHAEIRGMRRRSRHSAAAPIIAALSVQSSRGTSFSRRPRSAQISPTRSRSGPFAATPPPRATAGQSPCVERPLELRRQLADDRRLKARGKVGAALREAIVAKVARRVDERRLEAREAEVEARVARHRDRERERVGIAVARDPLDLRAARVAEAEDPRRLVERLAGGVVERLTEDLEPVLPSDAREQRVPTARDQAQEGRLERVGLEEVRRDVAVQVVHLDHRQAACRRQRLRGRDADQERADQARATRDGDRVEVVERDAGLAQAPRRRWGSPAPGGGATRSRARRRRTPRGSRPARR